MPNDYEEGRTIGTLEAKIDSLREQMREHIEKEEKILEKQDTRLRIVESWMQTTIGKITIITVVFGFIGSLVYTIGSYLIEHIKIK